MTIKVLKEQVMTEKGTSPGKYSTGYESSNEGLDRAANESG